MTKRAKTRIEKLVFTDKDGIEYVYVIKVAGTVSKSTTDILTKGLLLTMRVGKQRTEDALGRDMKLYGRASGRAFNTIRPTKCGRLVDLSSLPNTTYSDLIKAAIRVGAEYRRGHMDESISEAAPKVIIGGLPILVQTKHMGKEIKNDGKRYFVESEQKCANCTHMIKGKQFIDVHNGKVRAVTAFVPSEPTERAKTGSKKLLCSDCTVVKRRPEDWVIGTGIGAEERAKMMARAKETYLKLGGKEEELIKELTPEESFAGKSTAASDKELYRLVKNKFIDIMDDNSVDKDVLISFMMVMRYMKEQQ